MAEAAALEAALCPGRDDRGHGPHLEAGGRVSLRQRYRRLLRVDAGAFCTLERFHLDRRARVRLARAVARLHDDAIRPQGRARRPQGDVFEIQEERLARMASSHADCRTRQKFTTRSAVEGIRRMKFDRTFSISIGDGVRAGPSRSRIKARTVAHLSPIALPRIRKGS